MYSLYFGRNLCKSYKDLPFWKFLVVTYCKFWLFGVYLYRKEVSPMINEAETETETEEAQTEQNNCACGVGVCASFLTAHRTADKTII